MTSAWAIGLAVVSSFVGAFGPIFIKRATVRINRDSFVGIGVLLRSTAGNSNLLIGAAAYVIGILIYVPALRGGDLSVIYPLVSLSYVWVSLLSVRILHERMNPAKWCGIALIIAGATLVGLGS